MGRGRKRNVRNVNDYFSSRVAVHFRECYEENKSLLSCEDNKCHGKSKGTASKL